MNTTIINPHNRMFQKERVRCTNTVWWRLALGRLKRGRAVIRVTYPERGEITYYWPQLDL